jgi:hypothetical protein|tara:strand:- start:9192 stop:9635 length:444 start_codon:yes stop_codon:yes gene_type:complete
MQIELLSTVKKYKVKTPELTSTKYLAFCEMIKQTHLAEITTNGDEDGYLIFKTKKNRSYLKRILKELFAVVEPPMLTFSYPIPYGEIKLDEKFVLSDSYVVYTKTNIFEHEKFKSIGHEGCRVWMQNQVLVYPIDTENNFIYHKLKK